MCTINGMITEILTQKENDWGRFKINAPESKSGELLAVGIIPHASIGMEVCLNGEEVVNQYGKQFKINSVISAKADKNAGVFRYLCEYIPGFGRKTAAKAAAALGESLVTSLGSGDISPLFEFKKYNAESKEKIIKAHEKSKHLFGIIQFLGGSGTKSQAENIYKRYGDDAVNVLQKNPYRLQLDLDGFGFLRVDKLALAGGIKSDSVFRIMAGIKYLIENAQSACGHCYLTIEEIKAEIVPLLVPAPHCEDITEKVAENTLNYKGEWREAKEKLIHAHNPSANTIKLLTQTAETRKIISESIPDALYRAVEEKYLYNDDGNIYTTVMYKKEVETAKFVTDMASKHPVRYIKREVIEKAIAETEARKTKELEESGIDGKFVITDEQRRAVNLGLMNRVSIISGGPGRGKTAIVEVIINAFLAADKKAQANNMDDVIILAPTGRAAQRATESTGFPASTIHRTIYKVGTNPDGSISFRLNPDRPKNKLIIADEFSMADITLAHDLFRYAEDCNLILVGDVDQIASVGPGKVLKDLIDCKKIPCAMLVQGHRNSGSIAHNAQLINQGKKIKDYVYDEHFTYIPSTASRIADTMIDDYVRMVNKYGIKNVMLCTAMRDRGPIAVNKLNQRLQEIFTNGKPEAKFSESKTFRVGDRVMQTVNDYSFMVKDKSGEIRQGIFNGERGTVAKIDYSEIDDGYRMIVVFDDGSIGGYTANTAQELTLAYATTLHKCQGSEAPCMMMGYTYGDFMLLNKALFYTGETRAKKEFRFYGEEKLQNESYPLSAFDIAVSKTDDVKRHTALGKRIINLME